MAKNRNKLAAQQRRRQEVENELDRELEQTFPASDALQITRAPAGNGQAGQVTPFDHPSFNAAAGTRSSAVLWPSARTMPMAMMASPAISNSPPVKLPVESLIHPIA